MSPIGEAVITMKVDCKIPNMKTPLQLLTILITLACFAFSANAQDQPSATNIALAAQLVDLMHLDQGKSAAFDDMKQMQAKISDSVLTNVSPEARAMIEKSMDTSRNVAASVMSKDGARELYISAYARIYTAQELQGAIDFYKSPIGQKWVEKQPQVVTAVMEKTLDGMPQIMDSVKKSMGALDALRKSTNSILSNLLPSATPSSAPTN